MGTRSLTFVYENGKPILNLYRQYDGYPTGHGAELYEFLRQFAAITNGISAGETRKTANGMGCLAAQLVAHFKQSVGGFYIHSVDSKDCGQDYEYHVYEKNGEIHVMVKDRGCNMFGLTLTDKDDCIFDGPVTLFEDFCFEAD
jgi:hypothetical protein